MMLAPPTDLSARDRVEAHRKTLEQFGLPEQEIADALGVLPDPEFEPLPETVEAMNLFSVVSTQWRLRQVPVGMGASISKPFGLDYTACEAICRLRGLSYSPDTWAHLQILEQGLISDGNAGR